MKLADSPFGLLTDPESIFAEVGKIKKPISGRVYPLLSSSPPIFKSKKGKGSRMSKYNDEFTVPDIGTFSRLHFLQFCSESNSAVKSREFLKGYRKLKATGDLKEYWAQGLWCLKYQPDLMSRALMKVEEGYVVPTETLLQITKLERRELAHLLEVDIRLLGLWIGIERKTELSQRKTQKNFLLRILFVLLSFGEVGTIRHLLICLRTTKYKDKDDPIQSMLERRYGLR